ncbi:MAG: family 43 glycosylhydrolase [Ignavibacteriales bacterium]|nr:family 43 glycosylhydrolase [Ignavibacteriales bacterium]
MKRRSLIIIGLYLLLGHVGFAQSTSFKTYTNPVIPGDHPDCTVTKVGNDFYTTGSSFNPTPVIYHSTDLVHWEAIAQPVSAAWTTYGDTPSGGCWGGQVVYHGGKYWDFFSRSNVMYFVTADDIRGPWTMPTQMSIPAGVPGLGYDNSIFIDDDGSWYLLVKNGQVNNWIVQLGNDGQPGGRIYNLCWINPSPSFPYSWAEGPVMWKFKGNYYYSFARNVAGGQKVFRSATLTNDQASWIVLGDFFNEGDPLKSQALFQNPNHSSAAVMLDDSTSWVIHPLWRNANNNEWYGQGRQGLLNQVTYDANGKPTADYPTNIPKNAPRLPSSGVPWMVPHTDLFNSARLNPEWSFLGYTAAGSYSLNTRSGWLTLSPKRKPNTIIKNDGEHNYSIITRVDFVAQSISDQAGIWVFNGLQTLYARIYSSVDSAGNKIVAFSYKTDYYEKRNPAKAGANTLLLKLVRINHTLTGYWSTDSYNWTQIGNGISVADMDNLQADYNAWTGNRQGLFVQGVNSADFDYYIYRDAYTPILAECPANQDGTNPSGRPNPVRSLDNIHDGDWALYAGVEFGNSEYLRSPDSLTITASCASTGGVVEVWLDSLDSAAKIAECNITNTGSTDFYSTFVTKVLMPVSGTHDVYLKFRGTGSDPLFLLQWISFIPKSGVGTFVTDVRTGQIPGQFVLEQNYPNPFNPTTTISFQLPAPSARQTASGLGVGGAALSRVQLKVYDVLGKEVATLVDEERSAGSHTVNWNAQNIPSGVYVYRMKSGNQIISKAMVLLK